MTFRTASSDLTILIARRVSEILQVVVLRCDVTRSSDVTAALTVATQPQAGLPPVRGIIHAACPPQQQHQQISGDADDASGRDVCSKTKTVARNNGSGSSSTAKSRPASCGSSSSPQDPVGQSEVVDISFLDAKVSGAMHLSDGAARLGLDLDFLVLFSSASAVLGLAGEAGYAAANSCIDGLAW